MKAHQNRGELNEFVSEFNLKDQNSNIRFTAEVELKTKKDYLMVDLEVMVQYGGYNTSGELTLLDTNGLIIDAKKFPEVFKLDYQNFKYIDKSSLVITGNHPSIGEYKVIIIPTN